MKFRFTWIIFLLVIFVPFETLVLKYLPVSDLVYGYLRFAVEIIIYLLAGFLLARFIYLKKFPYGTSIDKPLLVFVGYALLITAINSAPLFQSFMGMRVLLRYIPLFYVLAFIRIEPFMVKRIFLAIILIAGIQGVITVYQHFYGISQFWYPRASDLEIGGKQVSFKLISSGFGSGREMGAGIGTFGDSVFLALFMVIAFTLMIASLQSNFKVNSLSRFWMIIILLLIVTSLLFTYSRGSVFVAFAAIPVIMFYTGGRKKLIIITTITVIVISPLFISGVLESPRYSSAYINPKQKYTDPVTNIITVFSDSYVDNTLQFSRGLVLTEVGGNLIGSFKLLGYSPAQDFALEKAATKLFGSNMPINNLPIINDVYWVAFIIYYGLIGLIIYFFILFKIGKASLFVFRNSPDPYFRIFAITMVALVIISIPYSLILRTFVFRSFGFYFWLIAGIVFSEWRRLIMETDSANYR